MKHKKMKPDGHYSPDHKLICAYSDYGNVRKEHFLHDAAALLRETAKHLAPHGLSQADIRVNRAGSAVSGEVCADYWNPDTLRGVWVEIGTTCLAHLSGRQDGVSILARWRTYKAEPATRSRRKQRPAIKSDGPNQWLSPEFNSLELAQALLKIYDPERTPPDVAAHTLSGGTMAIPSPFVSNETEATTWFHDNRAVEAAFQADQVNAVEAVAVPIPLTLFNELDEER
jgi:hypothetical protein